ncbi:MAG: PDZ domain-containing protein [Acidobacteriota bacterium]
MQGTTRWIGILTAPVLLVAAGSPVAAVNVHDTRLLSQPAVSREHIAFVYAGDLWSAGIDGSNVRRLTTHSGAESRPRFSPDGSTIAFSAQYDGNTDVFIVAVDGGVPQRLTWHPGADVVQGFTPDGSAVLFTSPRAVHTNRHTQLFTISVDGGMPEKLPIPHASKATLSPDGRMIAYTPLAERFNQWKRYRGGTVTRIWLYDRSDHSVVQIPQPEGRCNDTDPMWFGGKVYFRSDRNGEFNLFSYDPGTERLAQLTRHRDFPILNASAGGGRIIYEQAGYLHLFDPASDSASGSGRKLTVGVAADLIETRARYVDGARYLRNAAISPSGARAVFEYRGEIITVPAEKGDHRNLTNSTGVHDRSPAWSANGRWIAYISDQGGEYRLHIASQDGKGEVRAFPLEGAGFYEDLRWSPDSKKIAYTDNAWSLYLLDVDSGAIKKVASEPTYGPQKTLRASWSPDSRWLAYTLNSRTYFRRVYLYSLEEGRSHPVTDGLSDVSDPVFDAGGNYLYFLSSTDAGPVRQWFAMSNADVEVSRSIYLAVLRKGVRSPLAKESDEEEVADEEPGEEPLEESNAEHQGGQAEAEGDELVTVNFDGLDQRILALPVEAGNYSGLRAGAAGQIYYRRSEGGQPGPFGGAGSGSLRRFDLEKREEETLMEKVGRFVLSADTQKALISTGGSWLIASTAGKIDPSEGKISTDGLEVRIDPQAEWRQIFHEAWRINRDFFYDPNMHGVDWEAMGEMYSAFLDDIATRADLNRVIQWMSSELSVGHHRVGGGDTLLQAKSIPGGLLGADYEVESGRYRFAKVYGGLNWNPTLRSPLTEPGVDAAAGEYLLAVNGRELRPPENLYSRFENSAGKIVEITIGPSPDGSGARTVEVVPIANEYALRNRDWVEGNLKKVDEATSGRVAYVYVPNTSTLGLIYFKRYFYPQAYKEAIIVDERYNGGGSVADYYIDTLRRPYISHWAMRYGDDIKTPIASIQGPKVMIIDETAGSGGDLLPWMFRKLGLGPLIGKRTWGGLVGTLGFPVLMDGGRITAPNLAIWTEDGFVVENVGVPPDIEVEQYPAEIIAGRDPQLEKAIEVVMAELEANPPHKPRKPPYPIKAR